MDKKDITIILPTYNERENLAELLPSLISLGHPIIVVDDNSPDKTAEVAHQYASVNTICRKDERGLGSAIRRGATEATTDYVAVMDTDGQHSVHDFMHVVAKILDAEEKPDISIGSRFASGGGVEGLSWKRKQMSLSLNWMASKRARTKSSDYLTGMFCTRRKFVLRTQEVGFKILFEILKERYLSIVEFPITLHERNYGESKANWIEAKRFLQLVISR